ncbi:uncharacterized protein BXZ73DRAFT_103759 [Epithele typhae]|uniref:uncharacterized protein n=1 Tax=Epithele typhae TaxID=378194 RepID=UPI002007FE26|nr:uncharacterized protein BXZ73DRAFT_103759 [Epithele typhae]KAH9923713.1 hypothetical protein BXZ73DRAFT_103759 [Epithele typhae]
MHQTLRQAERSAGGSGNETRPPAVHPRPRVDPADGIVFTLGLKMSTIVALTAEATVGIGKTLSASDYRTIDPLAGVTVLDRDGVDRVRGERDVHGAPLRDELATARAVLVGCVPTLQKAVPYLADALGQITKSNHLFNQQARAPYGDRT